MCLAQSPAVRETKRKEKGNADGFCEGRAERFLDRIYRIEKGTCA